ncbi:putative cytochrome c-type biogenesis domain protein [Candidatus Erwinia dacicola]|uniref:Cytochrome c-type biogenesis domain protein n=1 Tax=Candidatus Erwinia dacicola TaxID=252393 RepID=A0A328TL88_9GAMM|nr:putative cytochrome c-type biogenesis domain protein [Candidatus Erwinia dacicola]
MLLLPADDRRVVMIPRSTRYRSACVFHVMVAPIRSLATGVRAECGHAVCRAAADGC